MKVLESKIFDFINKCLFIIQNKTYKIRTGSLLLMNIDYFILAAFSGVYIFSAFAENSTIALFASAAVILTVLKVLIVKGEKIELETCGFYLISYLFICLISNLVSSMPAESFYGFSKTILYVCFYFALCQFLKNNMRFIIPIFILISVLAAAESIIGIIQNHTGVLSLASWQDTSYVNPEHVISRAYGSLKPYNPNLSGGWLAGCTAVPAGLAALFFYNKKIIPAVISAAVFLISALCIFYTGCRGAYTALFAIVLCIIAALVRINKRGKMIAVLLASAGAAFIFLHKGVFHRILSIFMLRGDSSASFRMNVYSSALNMFKDNPVWGIGSGNKVFREIYGLYMMSGFDALSAYCVFLEIAVENGIFALAAFLMFLGSILFSGVRKITSSKNAAEKIILFTAAVSIIAVMTHGLSDTVFFRPQVQFIFWTMAAVLTVLKKEK